MCRRGQSYRLITEAGLPGHLTVQDTKLRLRAPARNRGSSSSSRRRSKLKARWFASVQSDCFWLINLRAARISPVEYPELEDLDAERAGQTVAQFSGCRAYRLHAEALGQLHVLSDCRICLTINAAERALRGFAMRESLCTPSSSICKHWKRVHFGNATRATFSGHRRFDRSRRQVVGTDLIGCARNNLCSRKNAGFDKAPYRVVCDA